MLFESARVEVQMHKRRMEGETSPDSPQHETPSMLGCNQRCTEEEEEGGGGDGARGGGPARAFSQRGALK